MTDEREYRVTWEIDVTAPDPETAALLARAAQVRPGTTATVFTVTDRSVPGSNVTVDLEPWSR